MSKAPGLLALFLLTASSAFAQVTDRVSVDTAGTEGNSASLNPALSGTGQFAAFESFATNLVGGDLNGAFDIFVRDRTLPETKRESVSGVEANGTSLHASISDDGHLVAFDSTATNLVGGDGNGVTDVFVRDRTASTVVRASVSTAGVEGNGASLFPAISLDGKFVAFQSDASNLVGDTNGVSDIFIRDLSLGTTTRVSVDASGNEANGASTLAAISSDGRFVAFQSVATNLVSGDSNGVSDVFLKDLSTGAVTRVSVDSAGGQANGASGNPAMRSDGDFIVFESDATNLVAGDANGVTDVFLHVRSSGATSILSISSASVLGDAASFQPSISSGGRWVAFASLATNLVAGDTNVVEDVFVRDLSAGSTTRISVTSTATQGNGDSGGPAISPDARVVAFHSAASNLVSGDTNLSFDVFAASNPLRAPEPGTVNDGPGADIDTQAVGTSIEANWSGFVAGTSTITSFEWAIGTTSGATNVQAFTSVGLATSATNSSLALAAGTTIFISVRGVDSNGNKGTPAVSDGVVIQTALGTGGKHNKDGKCNLSAIPQPRRAGSDASLLIAALAALAIAVRR